MAAHLPASLKGIDLSGNASADEPIAKTVSWESGSTWGDEEDDIVASWKLAIRQCREKLSEFDFSELQRFPTPEKLTEDLKKKDTASPNFMYIRRPIRTMKAFFAFFVMTMAPRTIESFMFWGLFYLLVDLADDQKDINNRWKEIMDMLEKVARSLDACKRSHQGVPFDEDMKLALNDAFIALITFWAETVAFMREHPHENDMDDITNKFSHAMRKVDESFSYLKECAASRDSNLNITPFVSGENSLQSMLPEGLALPCGDAPHYNDESFYGRQEDLVTINKALHPGSGKAQKFCIISGLGGVGKSKLALAYAKRYESQFEVTLWIKSQTQISLSQSFTEIAIDLRVPGADKHGNGDKNRELLFDYLKKYGKRWLVIWDNVERQSLIRPYLSTKTTTASMLVTTRYPEEAQLFRSRGPLIELQPFSQDASQELFAKLLGPAYFTVDESDDHQAAQILLKKMGGLAIGICTMAIRIKAKGLSIRSFLNRYRKGRLASSDEAELADYDLTLESIWNDSFSQLKADLEKDSRSEGYTMLGVLVFCSPDKIPQELFVGPRLNKLSDFPKFCLDFEEYLEAVDPLRKLGLITAEQDFKIIAIHRLVQSAFRKFLGDEACQVAFDLTVRLVHNAFPKQIAGRPLHLEWEQCRKFIQHGAWLADVYEDSQITTHPLRAPKELGELLQSCIWYLYEIGKHSEGLRISNIALKAVEKGTYLYGHLNNSMYNIYWIQNNLGRARTHMEVALDAMKMGRDEDSEEYIGIKSNLGNLLSAECRNQEALVVFRKVESIREQKNYPQNISQAFVHLGIGRLELQNGNLEEAEQRFLKASEIVRKQHGEKGQYMADVHYALGNLQLQKGNYLLASEAYGKGLELQKQYNKHHIFVSCFLYKLASIKMLMQELTIAKTLLDQALNIALLCNSEGDEARILFKMAQLLRFMGSMPDAPNVLDLERRAEDLKDRVEKRFELISPKVTQGKLSKEEEYSRLVCILHR